MSMLKPDPPMSSFSIKSGPPISTTGMPGGILASSRALPLSIPLPFLLTGICAAALFGLLLPLFLPETMIAPGFPHVLATVHIATLGWLTMMIMGASFQLIPVITVSSLHGARFIRWQYPLYISGVTLLISGFWWMQTWLLIAGGSLVVLAVIHYSIIVGRSLAQAETRPLAVRYLVASVVALCLVVSLGLTMALSWQFGFLGAALQQVFLAHLVLGIVGWLSNTLIGISYTLVRMFALVHGHSDWLGRFLFILLNTGIGILALGFIVSWFPLLIGGGIALIGAAWIFAYDFWRMLRVRRRKILDVTQYHSIAAAVYFVLLIPVGIAVALTGWQPPAILAALGLAALVGWLGQSTVGYLYKIVPFLIWQTRYGPLVGYQKVPLMRDLIHESWAWGSWWLINVGLVCTLISLVLGWMLPAQITSGLLGIGFILAAVNIFGVTRHLSIHTIAENAQA
ncbi:hypothetical protein KSF_010930 [Reticulibacter mediterranei]|uniref:Uncharacterized protein n=1 Tax=Reticulibacter mediterranei TaxID=2778369 RepID=A0A8J3N0A6_9CHLR|nr:cbb3-type cytochrome c oxidase subunit I [Reticulibacter mediterranei]GHO91045.1 hypothetical protein KSF_010930 [Reticulibacter mediterranei]